MTAFFSPNCIVVCILFSFGMGSLTLLLFIALCVGAHANKQLIVVLLFLVLQQDKLRYWWSGVFSE